MTQALYLSSFHPTADGKTNDYPAFLRCFSSAKEGDTVIIEAGNYLIDSPVPVPLGSGLTVHAEGAVFLFPKNLADAPHRILFYGENVRRFAWYGGCFKGYVYNPLDGSNVWEPSACTKCLFVQGTKNGGVSDLKFHGISSEHVAGSVVGVYGWTDERFLRVPARRIDVTDCSFSDSGKFMWDYGYLWQRIVFPEYHTAEEISNAYRYMPKELISGEITFSKTDLQVMAMPAPIGSEADTVSFFGAVPKELKRGNCYYIVKEEPREDGSSRLKISETPNGTPIRFSSAPRGARLFRNLFTVHHNLYAPAGCGTGKGPLDLSVCDDVRVSGCRLSASGDSMHIHRSHNVVFYGNQIVGSRMGAFFIAQFCKNVSVCANTVLGTNGSRVLSVEKSTEDITIVGNTFEGGGRGCWINQPYRMIMSDNIFRKNTNKCTPDPSVGRLTPNSGSYEKYPEIYFTTWEPNAEYGDVILRSNIIESTPYSSAAVAFHNGGKRLILESNILLGESRNVYVGPSCEMPLMNGNIGIGRIIREIRSEKFDQ